MNRIVLDLIFERLNAEVKSRDLLAEVNRLKVALNDANHNVDYFHKELKMERARREKMIEAEEKRLDATENQTSGSYEYHRSFTFFR